MKTILFTKEQIEETLNNALSFSDKLRAIDFQEGALTGKATENYLKLLTEPYRDDFETWNKVSNMIDGIMLLKNYQLTNKN